MAKGPRSREPEKVLALFKQCGSRVQRYPGAGGIELIGDVGGNPAAPTVILLHGSGQTRHSWGGAMAELISHGYHVINLDLRGHGDSQWAPDGDYTIAALADDLDRVMTTVQSRPALVGASIGGATALYLAGTRDARQLSALILVDIVPMMAAEGARKIGDFMGKYTCGFASLQEAADAVAASNPHRSRPANQEGLKKNLRQRDDGRWYWHWDPALIGARGSSRMPAMIERLNEAARRVRIPTLLVRGLRSDIVTDSGVADLKAHLPQLEVVDVGGAGHMVAGDDNDAFNRGIVGFLLRHSPVISTVHEVGLSRHNPGAGS